MNKEVIYEYMESQNFQLLNKGKSDNFGDYFDIFSNENVFIRFSSSKSSETVDICSVSDKNNWFDIALIKALLNNETILNRKTSYKEYLNFLKNDLFNIIKLFDKNNYPATKEELKILEHKRVEQMFPGMSNFK